MAAIKISCVVILCLLSHEPGAYRLILQQRIQPLRIVTIGDDHIDTGIHYDLCRTELCSHTTGAKVRACAPGKGKNFRCDRINRGDQLCIRIFPGIRESLSLLVFLKDGTVKQTEE